MRYRHLKNTELKISAISFGTWPISGHGMGSVNQQKAVDTIHRAVELGINFFDTADMYGFGYAEELLAKTLGNKRKEVVIATKVGLEWDNAGNLRKNLRPEYIIRACEDSLRRLKLERIDLYQLHWPDPDTPIEETVGALQKLIAAGKIRYVGVSNFSVSLLSEVLKNMPVCSNQIEYSMLERSPEKEVIPYCAQQEVSILAYKVLERGLLTGRYTSLPSFAEGDWRKEDPKFQGEYFANIQSIVHQLKPIADSYGCTLSQLATAWALRLADTATVIVGAKQPEQLEESCGGAAIDICQEDLATIDTIITGNL